MKKYAIPGLMLIVGHEAVSILALIVAVMMALADIIGEFNKNGGF